MCRVKVLPPRPDDQLAWLELTHYLSVPFKACCRSLIRSPACHSHSPHPLLNRLQTTSLFPLLTFFLAFPFFLLFIYKFAISCNFFFSIGKQQSEISFLSHDLKYFGGVMYGIRHMGCYQLPANECALKASHLITVHYEPAEWIWICNIRLRGSIDGITPSLSNCKKEKKKKRRDKAGDGVTLILIPPNCYNRLQAFCSSSASLKTQKSWLAPNGSNVAGTERSGVVTSECN